MKTQEERIQEMFEKGILLSKELVDQELDDSLMQKIEAEGDLVVLNSDYKDVIQTQTNLVDWYETDKLRVEAEKDRDEELYQSHLQQLQAIPVKVQPSPQAIAQMQEIKSLETALDESGSSSEFETTHQKPTPAQAAHHASLSALPSLQTVEVTLSFKNVPHKYQIQDFANFFLSRYKFLEGLLRTRRELQGCMTISRVLTKKEKEKVAIIGLVEDIAETKNGNIILTMEDITGKIKVLVSKNNKDLFIQAKDLVVDEVIGIAGTSGEKIIFSDTLVWPDIPATNTLKTGPTDDYAIFLSDLHVGSELFLETEFTKFLTWLQGKTGNDEQREIAQKVKYVFIAGDLVDGVGIYPSQEQELSIKTIDGQYKEVVRLLEKIPKHMQIIVCPGNHDVVHLAEPQPMFYQEFTPGLYEMENVTLVTNPSMVNIGKTDEFEGFNVLLYHGYSFDYYVANVESIRMGGGYHRSDLIMKFLLKRRHLAPSYKSTPYYPSHKEDPLLIRHVPDILITGHIHYSSAANYKGVTMICGSCWQGTTSFQKKLGHDPEPARVPVVNLKTRKVKVLRFG